VTPLRSPDHLLGSAPEPAVERHGNPARWEIDDLRDENRQLRTLVIELSRIILKNAASIP